MNPLFSAFLALGVACVTSVGHAQPAAAPASQQQASTAAPADPRSVEAKAAMCMGCHAIKGYRASFPEVYRVPMIAGQSAKYLAAALHAYKNGDRKHPTMRAIATTLSDDDMNQLAGYFEAQGKQDAKQLAEAPDRQPDPQVAGLMQKAACVSCHGSNFSKPIDPTYPRIAGQHPDYLFVALKSYKSDNNPSMGRSNGIMGAIAKQFSTAELKALATYVGSLETQLETKPESRFR